VVGVLEGSLLFRAGPSTACFSTLPIGNRDLVSVVVMVVVPMMMAGSLRGQCSRGQDRERYDGEYNSKQLH
jgi:hypothetical protein